MKLLLLPIAAAFQAGPAQEGFVMPEGQPRELLSVRHRVFMRFEGKELVIYGHEPAGKHREKVDPKSGKTLDNKVF